MVVDFIFGYYYAKYSIDAFCANRKLWVVIIKITSSYAYSFVGKLRCKYIKL